MSGLKPWQIRIPAHCQYCRQPFMAIRQLVLRGKGKYCSCRCSKTKTPKTRKPTIRLGYYRGVWIGTKKYKHEHTVIAETALDDEEQERLGVSRRDDLLKMHAYRDAIRRSAGAYVLFPGTSTPHRFREYVECTCA